MDFKDQVKSAADVVDVIGQFVRLKKVGSRYQACCPFHQEKTPSFSVSPDKGFFKCFGCGIGGDVFKFVQETQNISFYEALLWLAERYNIPKPKRNEYVDDDSKLRNALFDMHELAARQFQSNLAGPSGAEARRYLAGRAVSSEMAAEFGIGLSGQGQLVNIFAKQGFSEDHLEKSGLVLRRNDGSGFFDRFRNRLMFPIHNESGKVIGFGGRAIAAGDEPKYLNSPETVLYKKTHVLYNLHRAKSPARKAERMVLVEGYMDVIGVFAAGIHEVVASCGTALTREQVRMIKRHTDRMVVNFDPDAAGSNAAERSIEMLLEEGMQIRILELEDDLDPDEYVKQKGADQYRQRLDKAGGYFHWLADRARSRFDMRQSEGKVKALQFLLPAIQKVHEKLERAAVANDVAVYLGIEPGLVLDHFRRGATDRVERAAPARPRSGLPTNERLLIEAIIHSQAARDLALPRLETLQAASGFQSRPIFEAMFGIYRNQPDFEFGELEARLEEGDKTLMASILFADEVFEEKDRESKLVEQAQACLNELLAATRRGAVSDLKLRIKEAERRGDVAEALRLMGALGEAQRARTT